MISNTNKRKKKIPFRVNRRLEHFNLSEIKFIQSTLKSFICLRNLGKHLSIVQIQDN